MAIITISRNYANNGNLVAWALAEETGWPLVDKQVLSDVLSEYGMIELRDFLDKNPSFLDRFSSENNEYLRMMENVMMVLAKWGNAIIVGRGGFSVLKDLDNALHVLIKAPVEERIRLAMLRDNVSREEAEQNLSEKDTAKENFLKAYYSEDDHSTENFDLVVDVSLVDPEKASNVIADTARMLDEKPKAMSLNRANIEIDPILEEAVKKALHKNYGKEFID